MVSVNAVVNQDPMLVVDKVVGNVMNDSKLADMVKVWQETGRVERLRVDTWEAQKSRLRKRTDKGTEIGITLERGEMLRHGDVLYSDAEKRHLIMVEVEGRKVMVIKLQPQADAESMAHLAVKVGHMLGNQHWPVKVDGLTVYVPVVIAEKVMESVLKTHNVQGIEWHLEDADPAMDLPLVAPSLEEHVHAHPHQHGIAAGQDSGHGVGHHHHDHLVHPVHDH